MEQDNKKAAGYRLYIFTFVTLSILTLVAVGLAQVRLAAPVLISLVLVIATFQAVIVLLFNMHLKFHDKILTIFAGIVFSLIFLIIIITLVDYIYR